MVYNKTAIEDILGREFVAVIMHLRKIERAAEGTQRWRNGKSHHSEPGNLVLRRSSPW